MRISLTVVAELACGAGGAVDERVERLAVAATRDVRLPAFCRAAYDSIALDAPDLALRRHSLSVFEHLSLTPVRMTVSEHYAHHDAAPSTPYPQLPSPIHKNLRLSTR
jgi:hypothetical protein